MATDTRSDWQSYALTEVFDVRSGLSKPASEFGSGFPFVTFKDVLDNYFLPETLGSLVRSSDNEREQCDVRRGDVFLTRTSETQEDLGMSCVALRDYERATFNGFTKRLRPKDSRAIVPEYAAYYLRSPRFRSEMSAFSSLSTRASLNNDMLSRLQIVLPDVKTQEAIGFTLRSLDDKIEQNRRTGAKLEGLARAVFKAWFVDFEPVKAKAAGGTGFQPVMGGNQRKDAAATFPGMPPETFAALPTRFEDSELGPVPQGWEVTRWGEIASLEYGKSLKGYQDGAGSFRVFGTNGPIGWHTAQLADGPGIVIGRKGAYRGVHFSPGPFWAIDTAFFLKPKRPFSWKWAYYELLRVDINGMDSGSAIPSTSRDDFYSLPVCLPQLAMFRGFDAVFAPVFEMLVALNDESAKLATLRDYLLPRLLSGRVRVGGSP